MNKRELHDTALEVFNNWREVCNHPRAVFDAKRQRRIIARLKDGFTLEELCAVARGVCHSPFHMGENDTKTKYDGIDTIYRDAEQVEKFIELSKTKQKQEKRKLSEWELQKLLRSQC